MAHRVNQTKPRSVTLQWDGVTRGLSFDRNNLESLSEVEFALKNMRWNEGREDFTLDLEINGVKEAEIYLYTRDLTPDIGCTFKDDVATISFKETRVALFYRENKREFVGDTMVLDRILSLYGEILSLNKAKVAGLLSNPENVKKICGNFNEKYKNCTFTIDGIKNKRLEEEKKLIEQEKSMAIVRAASQARDKGKSDCPQGIFASEKDPEDITVRIRNLQITNNTPVCDLFVNEVKVGIITIDTDSAKEPCSFEQGTMTIEFVSDVTKAFYDSNAEAYASDIKLLSKLIRDKYPQLMMLGEARSLELFDDPEYKKFLCYVINHNEHAYYLISGEPVVNENKRHFHKAPSEQNKKDNAEKKDDQTNYKPFEPAPEITNDPPKKEEEPEPDRRDSRENSRDPYAELTGGDSDDDLIWHPTLGGYVFEKKDAYGNGTGEYVDAYGQPTSYGDDDDDWWL